MQYEILYYPFHRDKTTVAELDRMAAQGWRLAMYCDTNWTTEALLLMWREPPARPMIEEPGAIKVGRGHWKPVDTWWDREQIARGGGTYRQIAEMGCPGSEEAEAAVEVALDKTL